MDLKIAVPEFILDEDVWGPDSVVEPLFALDGIQQQVRRHVGVGEGQPLKK